MLLLEQRTTTLDIVFGHVHPPKDYQLDLASMLDHERAYVVFPIFESMFRGFT